VLAFVFVFVMVSTSFAIGLSVVMNASGTSVKSQMKVVYLSGSATEQGVQYGHQAGDLIRENIAHFRSEVASEGLPFDVLVSEALMLEKAQSKQMIEGLKAMAAVTGVNYDDLLAMNMFDSSVGTQDACTIFIAAGSGTTDGQVIASKNRDASKPNVLLVVEPGEDTHGFVAVGGAGEWGISFGLNDIGLCEGNNWMPVPAYDPTGIGEMQLNRLVLEKCSSVDGAIDYVSSVPKHGGSTVMVADNEKGAFIETVSSIYTPDTVAYEVTDGASVHTNHYLYEPFHSWALSGSFGYFWGPSVARYDRGCELLSQNEGKLSADMLMTFARDLENFGNSKPKEIRAAHPEIPAKCWSWGWPGNSICNAATVSSGVFELDPEYPSLLSVMWTSIYNPAWCPYVPVHNALIQTAAMAIDGFAPYVDGTMWSLAEKVRNCGKNEWGDFVPTFESWEGPWMSQTSANEADAAAMIGAGQVDQACSYLAQKDIGIGNQAYTLMLSLK
jgi:predicted choloylglycine hydrolase